MKRETPLTTEEALKILDRFPIFLHDEYYLDDDDIEAIVMATSALRSEYMEEQAGADQKAWEARSCRGCKHEDRGLYDEPCVSCEPGKYNLWERKEETKQ